jgi:hypothetical protein
VHQMEQQMLEVRVQRALSVSRRTHHTVSCHMDT